jgi:hypothetical protein
MTKQVAASPRLPAHHLLTTTTDPAAPTTTSPPPPPTPSTHTTTPTPTPPLRQRPCSRRVHFRLHRPKRQLCRLGLQGVFSILLLFCLNLMNLFISFLGSKLLTTAGDNTNQPNHGPPTTNDPPPLRPRTYRHQPQQRHRHPPPASRATARGVDCGWNEGMDDRRRRTTDGWTRNGDGRTNNNEQRMTTTGTTTTNNE